MQPATRRENDLTESKPAQDTAQEPSHQHKKAQPAVQKTQAEAKNIQRYNEKEQTVHPEFKMFSGE